MSDPQKYRTKEEVAEWKMRDPIELIKDRMLKNKIVTVEELDAIDVKIRGQVDQAVNFAEESPWPKPEEAFEDIYVQSDYPFLKE